MTDMPVTDGSMPDGSMPDGSITTGSVTNNVLVVDGLTAGYGGGDVLHEVSFAVPEGSITCIVGPNGAGKSTLLAVISGLLKSRSGQVLHRGKRLTGKSPREILRAGVVHVPQNHSLFREMTVTENIELGGYTLGSKALVADRRAAVEGPVPHNGPPGEPQAGRPSCGHAPLVER